MKVKIEKSAASGTVTAPASKSIAHRLLICAAMSDGKSRIKGISNCEDVLATIDCLGALGIRTERDGNDIIVEGQSFGSVKPSSPLRCRESGSTLRFMIPCAMLSGHTTVFYGEGRLMKRPMEVYEKLFQGKGLTFIQDGESIVAKGPLKGGNMSWSAMFQVSL